MKTWVTKYGYPEAREQVEHDAGDCAACQWAGSLHEGGVLFVEVEKSDGSRIIRRVEGLGEKKGFFANEYGVGWLADETPMVGCRIVSREDVDREIAEARAKGWYHEHERES